MSDLPIAGEKPVRLIFVVSDIHAGSTLGLCPPGHPLVSGNNVGLNPFQDWLWQCWLRANTWIDSIAQGCPYALVMNGDMTEGVHHRTTEIVSSDPTDHVMIAKTILQPLVDKAAKSYMVLGTECHTHSMEISIAESFGCELNEQIGKRAFNRLQLDACGVPVVFRHHIGTSVRMALEATQLSVNLVEEQVEALKNGETPPRILCCAHRHKFGYYTNGRSMCIVSPPWQGLTRFGHKVVSQARTQPGIFALDWRNKKDGELPLLHSKTYDSPASPSISL